MSENLKRAESLFNRIMNQNGGSSNTSGTSSSSSSKVGGGNGQSKSRHHYNNSSNNSSSNSGNPGSHGGESNAHHHYKGGYKSYNNTSNANNSNNSSNSNVSNSNNNHSHGHHHNNSHNSHSHSHSGNNGNSTQNNRIPNPNIELPKKDPNKIAEITLSEIPEGHHILPYCWTIWHHSRAKPKQRETEEESASTEEGDGTGAIAVNSYLQTTNEIEFPRVDNPELLTTNIGSLEQMWSCLASLKKTYELPIGTELLFFKSGVNPVWEDPINTKGGRWVFRFSRRLPNNSSTSPSTFTKEPESSLNIRKKSSLIWERLILKTMTGSIIPDATYSEEIQDLLLNDISGLVLSVRKDEDIISIWNSNLNFNKKKSKEDADDKSTTNTSKKLITSFQARRIICDSILRIIRECKSISRGSDSVETLDSGSNERVYGVSFEYRLHSDNNNPMTENKSSGGNGSRRYPKQFNNNYHNNNSNNHHSNNHNKLESAANE